MASAASGITALTNEEVAAQQVQSSATREDVYIDQLIDESVAEDLPPDQLGQTVTTNDEQEAPGNLRFLVVSSGVNYSQTNQDNQDTRIHTSLSAGYQTLNYGDFRLEAKFKEKRNSQQFGEDESGSHFVLRQDNFLLNEDWTMENTLGVNQNYQNHLVSSSGYVNLASHTFFGTASRVYSEKTELRLMAGEKGDLSDLSEFNTNGQKITGVGLARRMNNKVVAGGQVWHIDSDLKEPDEEANDFEFSAFINYQSDNKQRSAKLQLLSTGGNHGFWVDGRLNSGRFNHQAGFYHLDDKLQWIGEALSDDLQGAFWRMSYKHPRFSTNTSLDWQQRAESLSAGMRHSVHYYLNRELQLGGGLAHSYTKNQQTESHRSHLNAHVHYQPEEGRYDRLQFSLTNNNQSADATEQTNQSYDLNYTHHRLLSANNSLDLQFTVRWDNLEIEDNYTMQAGVSWRKKIAQEGHLGANFNGSWTETGASLSTSQSSRLYVDYQVNKNWSVSGGVSYAQRVNDRDHQFSANIQINYSDTRGQPITARHRRSGGVRGLVFYDINNDGIRQPLEKIAPGITVELERGGLPQTSDANGEFEFLRMPPGGYRVNVAEESIPLPWELAENGAKRVNISLRQTEFVYLPLVRLSAIE